MLYTFDGFEIDIAKFELRQDGQALAIEPQVLSLLILLVENRDRLVSREELVEKIWDGRIVSEAAIASRIKSARRALGDDGKEQRFIRTVHGKGLRFVGRVRTGIAEPRVAEPEVPLPDPAAPPATRPSIAVVPFHVLGTPGPHAAIGEALAHDLIAVLTRARWLFVIARGSSFRFRSQDLEPSVAGQILNVRYVLSGVVEVFAGAMTVVVELTDTSSGRIIWAHRLSGRIEAIHEMREEITARIPVALELEIPLNEANNATFTAPADLDSWSAYHLGLKHLYRFNGADNSKAMQLFGLALEKDPRSARANAGLSAAYFQSAFLRYSPDRAGDTERTRRYAERSTELDPLDPFANLTLGRAFWLTGEVDRALPWLERATDLSPNYAQAHYSKAWAETVSQSDAAESEAHITLAMSLSPLDPFYYAMLATRALICLNKGDPQNAARWADRAACAPGSHVMVALIAVAAHALHEDPTRAQFWANDVHTRRRDVVRQHFFTAFPYPPGDLRRRIDKALADNGF